METLVRVDLTRGAVTRGPVPENYRLLGGRGLISRILLDESDATVDTLRPESLLIVTPGLLGGTGLSSSGRISIGGKSPLTGGIKESNGGGTTGGKLARLDIHAIVITGKVANGQLSVLRLTKNSTELLPADDLAGLGCYETASKLRDRYGSRVGVTCVGPVGEMGSALAGVANTDVEGAPSRYCGRGGLGAVMGSKGLKAIVIDDTGVAALPMADRASFREAVGELTKLLRESPVIQGFYRKLGTPLMVSIVNGMGGLPTRNFSNGNFEQVESICGENMLELIKARGGEGQATHACMPGCLIECSNVYPDQNGRTLVSPLEFETIGLLGSNCGIGDLDVIAHLNWICNDIGIDTIEAGATIGVAMEGGVVEFGDATGAIRLLEEMREGTILGRVLAQGATTTAKVLGVLRVPTIKGQAMPAYDPRAIKGNGTTYATSPMGADHTAGNLVRAKSDPLDPSDKADLSRAAQITAAAYDTLGLCVFAAAGFGPRPDLLVQVLRARYGVDLPDNYVEILGKEALMREKEFNRRAGFTEAADRMPATFRTEPLPPHNTVFDVSPEDLDRTLRF